MTQRRLAPFLLALLDLLDLLPLLAVLACGETSSGDQVTRTAPPPSRDDAAAPADAAFELATPAEDATPGNVEVILLPPAPPLAPTPLGLPVAPSPAYNPTTPEKVVLGELLFFDPRLSRDRELSCASCHVPELGFADGRQRARTAAGTLNLRHTPALLNLAYRSRFAWDGAHNTLEGQILANWRGQMAANPAEVAERLTELPTYRAHFLRAFGGAPSGELIAKALAAFIRTLTSGDAPWDRFEAGADGAVSEAAIVGFRIFSNKAGCVLCHAPPFYTDHRFHARREHRGSPDSGRARVTGDPADRGAFMTPSLRHLARTAPYFHDGESATLEEAVRRELERSHGRPHGGLTADERAKLLAFLLALTPESRPRPRPELP